MQLFFIRHAQSTNNALRYDTGNHKKRTSDPLLTEIGQQQAELVGAYVGAKNNTNLADENDPHNRREFGLTHLYCSLMTRAIVTGTCISKASGVPLVAWPEIHEIGGIYDRHDDGSRTGIAGPGADYFAREFPHLQTPTPVAAGGWWDRPSESWDEARERARGVLATLYERHRDTDDKVGLVSHGGFYWLFMRAVLGMEDKQNIRFTLSNTAITRIDLPREDDSIRILYHNRVDHLPHHLVT